MIEALLERTYSSGGQWQRSSQRELLVFDVSLYSPNSHNAVVRDGVGLIIEKISGENENGQQVLGNQTKISLQMTPPEHYYLQLKDSNGLSIMVAPENTDSKKDMLSGMTGWRRGLDIRAMSIVREQFFQAKEGDMFFWCSPKAEEWEEETVRRYNGEYGYLYAGKVVFDRGVKKLLIHDFKNDLPADAYEVFFKKIATHFVKNHKEDELYLDKVMTTVAGAKISPDIDLDDNRIWRLLSEAKKEITRNSKIQNLPVEVIIGLQDRDLHRLIQDEAATEVADWLISQKNLGKSNYQIQTQIRQKYIEATWRTLNKNNLIRKYNPYQDMITDLEGGRMYRYSIDPLILKAYRGSSGDSCGSWGSNNSTLKNINFSSAITGLISSESNLSGKCSKCGINHAVFGGCGFCESCGEKAA